MTYLIVLSLATAIGWEILRFLAPFEISVRIAPLLVVIIGLGLSFCDTRILLSFSAAGGVALFHKVTGGSSIDPWKLPKIFRKKRTSGTNSRRIPEL